MSQPSFVSFLAFLILSATALAADPKPAAADSPPYPEGFLQWKQLKATTLEPNNPATAKLTSAHFVYANDRALEGLRTGHYPEDAVFVLDIFKVARKDGVATLGARDSTSSMVRDPRFAATGGWAFVDFDVATRQSLPTTNPVTDCYQCHTRRADFGYVFTELH